MDDEIPVNDRLTPEDVTEPAVDVGQQIPDCNPNEASQESTIPYAMSCSDDLEVSPDDDTDDTESDDATSPNRPIQQRKPKQIYTYDEIGGNPSYFQRE